MATAARNFVKSSADLWMKDAKTRVYVKKGANLAKLGLSLTPWALPGAIAGGWLVYPALNDNFKKSIGLPVATAPGIAPAQVKGVPKGVHYVSEEIDEPPVLEGADDDE